MKSHLLLIVSLTAGLIVTGRAQQPSIDQRLEQLEQEIRVLKRQRELDQEAAQQKAQEAAKTTPIIKAGSDGFALQSADGKFVLKIKGYLQADSAFFLDDDAKNGTDVFQISRARPILEGTVFKSFDFRIMPDFGQGQTVLYDAYAEWKQWPWLKVRAGKFKPPVGLELLQSDVDTLFVARGLPVRLVPQRDVGVQFAGDLNGGVLQYQLGVFDGVVDGGNGDLDNGDGKDFEGRLFVEPFKKTKVEPLQGLGFGVAGTIGNQDGSLASPNLPGFKTSAQNTFFKYLTGSALTNTVIANGQRIRYAPQGYYYWGSFGLLGEYTLSEQEVHKGQSVDHLRNTGWQVAGAILLTGEHASYKGVSPLKPFNPKNGGWGAVELVGRYSVLRIDPDAFPVFASPTVSAQEARAWAVGVNWYLNKNVRLVADYEQTEFDGGATGGKDRATEHVLFTRAQLAF